MRSVACGLPLYKAERYTGINATMQDVRHQIGVFLRAKREAQAPLPGRARQRTPGLRREDVAALAGLSTTWVAWVEQGREMPLTAPALSRMARALSLSAAERGYLFELARLRDPEGARARSDESSELLALIGCIKSPAYVLGPLYECMGWNEPGLELFAPWVASGERNLLRFVFMEASARAFIVPWGERAARLVAEFRADSARVADEAGRDALIAGLRRERAEFETLWTGQGVLAREGGERVFCHPAQGVVRYVQTTLIPAVSPEHRVIVLRKIKKNPES